MQVGEERSIVSAISGTTRDAVDMDLTTPDGLRFTLIDTAGIRKRTAVADSKDGAEPLSVNRAVQAIRFGFPCHCSKGISADTSQNRVAQDQAQAHTRARGQ